MANRKAIKNTKRAEIDVEKQPSIDKDILKNEKTSENKQDFTKEKETKTAEVTPSVAVKDEPLINNELNSVSPQPPKASASMPADVATDTVINNYKNPVPSGIKPEKVSYPSPLANMNEEKFHKMIASALLVATQYGDKRHKTR
ncbi:MAG: hypothetical protein Q4G04_02180 [bacterium]|nr:hypothetical protein [bacterium]